MSRAFAGLGFTAAVVFIVIIVANAIKGGARGVAQFIENYYWLLGIILFIIISMICVLIFGSIESKISDTIKIVNCIFAGLAMAQNAGFLVYGLYKTLTVYQNDAFLTLIAFGGFVIVYVIDCFITFFGTVISVGKPWGSVVSLIIAIAGLYLIFAW